MKENAGLRVAYLVNQYPKVSHTFIHREILALETLSVTVDRFALRDWDGDTVDPVDLEERDKTAYTLREVIVDLMLSAVKRGRRHPGPVLRGQGRDAARWDAALAYHLVYVAHACRIVDWLNQRSVAHFGRNPAETAHLVKVMGGRAIVSRCMAWVRQTMPPDWPLIPRSGRRNVPLRSAPIPAAS